ncbi:hypothetical protein BH09VER1_BH09VER1_49400 [soil metagenome]
MRSSPGLGLFDILLVVAVLVILGLLLYPMVNDPGIHGRSSTRNDVTQIATAVNAFVTEYGVYPGTNGAVGGDLLAVLTGSTSSLNPRKLVFLEVNVAKKNRSGITNGVFVDPWGGAYQIAMASGTNQWVVAGTNGVTVRKQVAVWSDPSLDRDGASLSELERKKRYVNSWE